MAVYIKNGGAWRQCGDGRLYIKWNGAWRLANYCYRKTNGNWVDSGYRSYPNPPSGIRVASWDFGQVTPYWDAPAAGGAPVSYYHVVKTNEGGGWVAEATTTSQSYSFGVSQDERCQFYVRSIGPSGLASAFNGPLRCQIGHTELSHQEARNGTEAWGSGIDVNSYNQVTNLIYVPNSVAVSSWFFNLSCTFSTGVISPTASREVNHIFANVQQGEKLNWSNPLNGWFSYVYWGQDSWWGWISHGSGWSASPTGGYRIVGRFEIHGTRHYTYYVTVIDRNYAGNSYW